MSVLSTIFDVRFSLHLIINLFSLIILLRFCYQRIISDRDTLFGFFLFGNGVFIVTALLHDVEMSMGFAFGLFAVFSMLRYRTESISIQDMSCLFIVIVISLISSVAPIAWWELLLLNGLIVALVALGASAWFAPCRGEQVVLYERVDLIQPQHRMALIEDLTQRTGLNVVSVDILEIDFLRDTARLKLHYER